MIRIVGPLPLRGLLATAAETGQSSQTLETKDPAHGTEADDCEVSRIRFQNETIHFFRKQKVEMDTLQLRCSWEASKAPGAIALTVTGLQLQVITYDKGR